MSLSRRNFLAALGLSASAASLGVHGATRRAFAAPTGPIPKRMILVLTTSGTIKQNWRPDGSGASFPLGDTLSPILAPLMPFKNRMLAVDGLDMRTDDVSPGGPHPIGMGGVFTGWELQKGDFVSGGGLSGWANGPSIDQVIARASTEKLPFSTLEFGVQVRRADNYARMIFRAPGQPLPPMENPYDAFSRLFGAIGGTPAEQAALAARRKSVLDFVRNDLTSLGTTLGGDDKHRLDAHVEGIRAIEARLQTTGETGAACKAPVLGAPLNHQANENYPTIGELQMDLLVSSLACGMTRVGSLQWSRGISQTTFPWLGIKESHHSLSHRGDADTDARSKLTQINRWYAQQLAYLCKRLDEIPERDGKSLLDHTLIVWANELSKGNNHSHDDMPFVLLGGAGGALKMGRYANFPARPHNDLLVTICRAMGLDTTSFGNPKHCTGAIAGLLA